jgi:dihydroflavonol-4-reductase
MKIFVTGGTGFIGTHLVKCLAETEHELVCLARKTSDQSTLKELGVTIALGDVTDKVSLLKGMQGCDWVANLANLFLFWVPDERSTPTSTSRARGTSWRPRWRWASPRLSTSARRAVWGKTDWPISEETPIGARKASEYAQTKYEGEQIAWRLHKEHGLPLVMVYPAAVVGPDDPKAPAGTSRTSPGTGCPPRSSPMRRSLCVRRRRLQSHSPGPGDGGQHRGEVPGERRQHDVGRA